MHSLLALRETLPAGAELTTANVAIGYVAEGVGFTLLEDEAVQPFLDSIGQADGAGAPAAAAQMEE